MKKTSKLIREIRAITDNPDLHFWTKCKELTKVKTHNRPGSWEGREELRKFFKTCAGRFHDRFESAYVRPYLDAWQDRDRSAFDHVNKKELNTDLACKIGRQPRGITDVAKKQNSQKRFASYIKAKYPDGFEEFEELKRVSHCGFSQMERTRDCAWQHIFGSRVRRYPCFSFHGDSTQKALWQTPEETQRNRRKFDLAMEKTQKDYNRLKETSGLPPRYLYNEVSLAELQHNHKNHTYAIYKEHYITTETVLHYDDSEVRFGLGSLASTDRAITIRGKGGAAMTWNLKAYRGNFVLNAIEERFGMVKSVKTPADLKPVQLNPKMEVVEIAKSNGCRIFKRLFSGVHYDYCALRAGLTYHGKTIEQCIDGWKKKKALSKKGARILNMKAARALGFCPTGIRQFCSDNNMNSGDEFTVEELKTIVNKSLSRNKHYYGRELQSVGIL